MEPDERKKLIVVIGLIFVGLVAIVLGLVISTRLQSDSSTAPDSAQAGGCPFVITKARAQLNAKSPWTESLSVDLAKNKSIRIVGIQCKSNANCDSEIVNAQMVLDGAGFTKKAYNITNFNQIPTVDLIQTGKITLTVTYPGYTTGGCLGTATITVTDSTNDCPYVITKARAQLDVKHPWEENLNVDLQKNTTIRVMGFQCKTSTSCDSEVYNAVVELKGAGFTGEKYTITNLQEQSSSNPNGIPVVKLLGTGTIDMKVTASNSTDAKCTGTAKINVVLNTPKPTAKPSTPKPKVAPKVSPKTGLESDQLALISGLVIMVLGGLLALKYRQNKATQK